MDKSLLELKPPLPSLDHRPSVLAAHHSSGVGKRRKGAHGRKSAPSHRARLRQERAVGRGAAVLERTLQRVERSERRERAAKGRNREWAEVNNEALAAGEMVAARGRKKAEVMARILMGEGREEEEGGEGEGKGAEEEWLTDDDEEMEVEQQQQPEPKADDEVEKVAAVPLPLPPPEEVEGEIL